MGARPPLMRADLRSCGAVVLAVAAAALAPPDARELREFTAWLLRPASLPFAWRAVAGARATGDHAEVFARSQAILELLPSWTDGHLVSAYRYALAGDGVTAATAARRLRVAMAWLAAARAAAGRRELELLQALAMLPEVACHDHPDLADELGPAGGPAVLADAWLAEAERLFPTAPVREQRTFHAPRLAAALLAAGDRAAARAVLAAAIDRSLEVRDQQLAAEWRARLTEVVRRLDGDPQVDLAAVAQDARLAPLLPYLR